MNVALNKLSNLGLNKHAFTENDFYKICELEHIQIIEIDEEFSWWMNFEGENFIVLSRHLRGYKLLFTMFHELSHYFLHSGTTVIELFGANNSREEYESDVLATIFVYPAFLLITGELLEYEEFDPFLKTIREKREEISTFLQL